MLQRLEARLREVSAVLQQLVECRVLLSRDGFQRAADDDGKFQTLRLMDRQEGDAASGRVLGVVLVLADAAVAEETQELVEQVAQVFSSHRGSAR